MVKVKKLIIGLLVLQIILAVSVKGAMAAGLCDGGGGGEGGDGGGSSSTLTGSYEGGDDLIFRWDPANPEEMGRNSEIEISVIGGCTPYLWSLSGEGFWFDAEFTLTETKTMQEKTVTLYTDDTACATEITVKNGCGEVVTGYVRYPAGSWVYKGAGLASGHGKYCSSVWGPEDAIYIRGYQKWVVDRGGNPPRPTLCCGSWVSSDWGEGDWPPRPPCGTPLECDGADCGYWEGTRMARYFWYYEWECP
jgi:hypothetical protein